MKVFESPEELTAAVGEHLGYSDWHVVTQEQVQLFADATGDHQWIHLDAERAAQGPFGTTIAHGYLTLSLLPMLAAEVYRVKNVKMGVNYGLNRVRFPSPVPTGSRVRVGITLASVEPVSGGYQLIGEAVIEREGGDKPCCVAQTVSRVYL
ncbi:MaoC family dehydratase [Virgisporangium aliadipatigenens]|uniref:MaoC family dehydratase n=1 Tax=Virgisporangium aliadipatigenens TaxID=741659 RepID=A0A8J4DRB7_9ACTN|nr:MaoC family dehydratase [Virgisporangium aliadipatigenens]GIJ46901.1 MaoC family dehydratase [Virgisporangium aliadipatigenens]